MSDVAVQFPIEMSDAAAAKVKALITEEENPELKLRVYITGGGCSGFQYGFTFDEKINDGDTVIEKDNVIMVVDLALEELATAERAAMTESVRALTQVLTERYPGRTIEVRIPPYAAVQVGALSAGPSHTRGTPPNVVEFAPETFWELATGRQSWQRAAASGTLTFSGAHAGETARMFPIVKIR